jgi:hypothetical protein
MNGAELPCGTALGVQPADMDYKNKAYSNAKEVASSERVESTDGMNGKSWMSPSLVWM